ncbi:MAG: Mobile element protein, partial [uncultured Chloroflexia bacterium]
EREGRPARREAVHRDMLFEPQAGLRAGRDASQDAGGARYEDRGEDSGLHLRFPGHPPPRQTAGADQGAVGL